MTATKTKVADRPLVTITYRATEEHRTRIHVYVAKTPGATQQSVCTEAVERYLDLKERSARRRR